MLLLVNVLLFFEKRPSFLSFSKLTINVPEQVLARLGSWSMIRLWSVPMPRYFQTDAPLIMGSLNGRVTGCC